MKKINNLLDNLEDTIYGLSAVFLIILSLIIYGFAVYEFINDFSDKSVIEGAMRFIEHILLALVLAGLVHTIKITILSKKLRLQPYLVVGIIASIRRIIILTVRVSKVLTEGQQVQELKYTLYEIIILSVVTILLALSIKIINNHHQLEEESKTEKKNN